MARSVTVRLPNTKISKGRKWLITPRAPVRRHRACLCAVDFQDYLFAEMYTHSRIPRACGKTWINTVMGA